jgi:hypothetical protein
MNESLDKTEVNVDAMFLIGTTNIWWRNRVEDLVFGCTMEKTGNWEEMKATLKAQFGMGSQS